MTYNEKVSPGDFANYLQSIVKLDALEKITSNLDDELKDSQQVMDEIKAIFDSIPSAQNARLEPMNNELRHEHISKFLGAGAPRLLMDDMIENTLDVDLDNVIASMKIYAEDLKKNLVLAKPLPRQNKKVDNLDLEQYTSSLDQLGKRLANIKLSNRDQVNNRNANLEAKLTVLCEDVNMLTQMVEAKTTLSEANKNWRDMQGNNAALDYDNIVNKLLSGINEVTYLLKNNN